MAKRVQVNSLYPFGWRMLVKHPSKKLSVLKLLLVIMATNEERSRAGVKTV